METKETHPENTPKYEQTRRKLIAYIRELPADVEFLPYEYELEQMFGVSRVSVRRALAELRQAGIIQTLRGSGSRILKRNFDAAPVSEVMSLTAAAPGVIFPTDNIEGRPIDAWLWWWLAGFERRVRAAGGPLSFFNVRTRKDEVLPPEAIVSELRRRNIRWAAVHCHSRIQIRELLEQMIAEKIKPVLLFEALSELSGHGKMLLPGVDFVAVNQNLAIDRALREHFATCDYILMCSGDFDLNWVTHRARVVWEFAAETGAEFELAVDDQSGWNAKMDSLELFQTLRETGRKLTAVRMDRLRRAKQPLIFGANDIYALGAMAAVREAGLEVPGQVEVLGFDNKPEARNVNLSTFEPGSNSVGKQLFLRLQAFLNHPDAVRTESVGTLADAEYFPNSTTRWRRS